MLREMKAYNYIFGLFFAVFSLSSLVVLLFLSWSLIVGFGHGGMYAPLGGYVVIYVILNSVFGLPVLIAKTVKYHAEGLELPSWHLPLIVVLVVTICLGLLYAMNVDMNL